mmetsp:Transcript_5811/g.12906  ORF Transcript_5811/g.12906 Transcript_5811/m.12906 type:complete len:220 (-) Transcript_5811:841-1500(-)
MESPQEVSCPWRPLRFLICAPSVTVSNSSVLGVWATDKILAVAFTKTVPTNELSGIKQKCPPPSTAMSRRSLLSRLYPNPKVDIVAFNDGFLSLNRTKDSSSPRGGRTLGRPSVRRMILTCSSSILERSIALTNPSQILVLPQVLSSSTMFHAFVLLGAVMGVKGNTTSALSAYVTIANLSSGSKVSMTVRVACFTISNSESPAFPSVSSCMTAASSIE